MLSEKRVAERLDQVGDDRRCRRTVKKYDLVHGERAPEPCLIDVGQPLGRRIILQRCAEVEVGALLDRRSWSPELRTRVGVFPFRQKEMVKLVRAHEVTNRTQPIHLRAQVRSQPDWRPYP